MAKLEKPTKGIKPRMEGVPGELIQASDVPANVIFGRNQKISPYDPKLKELLDAGTGSVLCFGNPRARASLYSRSKKLGMKVEFGELAGKLYVRLAPNSTPEAPQLETVKDTVASAQKTRNQGAILSSMRAGKKTPEAIAAYMRERENVNLDAPIVRSLLRHMKETGTVTLAKITPETWELAA